MIVGVLRLLWSDISQGLMKSLVVPPVHPAKGGDLDFTDRCPRPVGINQLCFVEPVDRFSQRVVIGVANGADRWIIPARASASP